MRNWVVKNSSTWNIIHNFETVQCYYLQEDTLYTLSLSGLVTKTIILSESKVKSYMTLIVSSSTPPPPPSSLSSLNDDIIIAYKDGRVLLINVETQKEILLFQQENGIVKMEWNSNHTRLALLTTAGHVVIRNAQGEILAQKQLLGVKDIGVSMTWKCDGNALALNVHCCLPSDNGNDDGNASRHLLLFSTLLDTIFVGRMEDGRPLQSLENVVAWCPSGALIACAQVRKKKSTVVFLEPNGLRHRQVIVIQNKNMKIKHLEWNRNGSLLAIALEQDDDDDVMTSRIQLWSRSNYQWDCKQEFIYKNESIMDLIWDKTSTTSSIQLLNIIGSKMIRRVTLHSMYTRNTTTTLCACINGSQLRITDWKQALIPPPMCSITLDFQSCITTAVFSPTSTSTTRVAVLTSDNHLTIQCNDGIIDFTLSWNTLRHLYWLCDTSIDELRGNINGVFLLVGTNEDGKEELLQVVVKDSNSCIITKIEFPVLEKSRNIGNIDTIISSSESSSSSGSRDAHIIMTNGHVFTFTYEKDTSSTVHFMKSLLQYKAGETETWLLKNNKDDDDALNTTIVCHFKSQLWINDTLIDKHCHSFLVDYTNEYLFYITLDTVPELRWMKVSYAVKGYEHTRRVESGAHLVGCIRPTVILQMPRGNIEGISPLPLVLDCIQDTLKQQRYAIALEMCRKHRIDMNFLYDYNPENFMKNMRKMITDIPIRIRSNRIILFLTSLHEEDVCQVKYNFSKKNTTIDTTNDKLNVICKEMITCLMEVEEKDHLFNCILTCDIKQTPAQYTTALLRLQELQDTSSVEKALQHLLYLSCDKDVIHAALGMYNITMAKAIVKKMTRDALMYSDLISSFESLPISFQCYKIDRHLVRNERALHHLATHMFDLYHSNSSSKLGEEQPQIKECIEECIAFVTKFKDLASLAASLFSTRKFPLLHRRMIILHGEYLSSQGSVRKAASVYLSAEPPAVEEAVSMYRQLGEWRMVFALVHKKITKHERQRMGYEMASELKSIIGQSNKDNYLQAGRILSDVCRDIESSIETLLEGHFYKEALHVALSTTRDDLIVTEIEPFILDTISNCRMVQFQTLLTELVTFIDRLWKIREKNRLFRAHGLHHHSEKEQPEREEDGSESQFSLASSAYSAASSTFTVGSHNSSQLSTIGNFAILPTHRSTTNHFMPVSTKASTSSSVYTKKKSKLKKGSAEEDAYLVKCIDALVPSVTFQNEIGSLVEMALYFQKLKVAKGLQAEFQEFLTTCQVNLQRLADFDDTKLDLPGPIMGSSWQIPGL